MGLSKAKLLYEQVKCGNVEGIKALHREGAGVEWKDKDGKTPLILACMKPDFLKVVSVLIDLGANVNADSPGNFAGTPLHHAAKKGFVQTVELLLERGAYPLLVNDGRKTPLDLARSNNHLRVVRLLESCICLFDGWLREPYGSSILGAINPQRVSRKIWAVILPCVRHNQAKHFKLAIYSDQQAVQPNPVIQLWKFQITEPDFNQPDPALVIVDKVTKKQYTFLSENEGDKEQLQLLRDACNGILQHNTCVPTTPALTPMPSPSVSIDAHATSAGASLPASEDVELDMVIYASIQSAIAEGVPLHGWAGPEIGPSVPLSSPRANQPDTPISSTSAQQAPPMVSVPSAPPIVEETSYAGLCVICQNATAEGASVPCGHKAGCMSCLKNIKARKGRCPICRAKIDQVMKVYDVS